MKIIKSTCLGIHAISGGGGSHSIHSLSLVIHQIMIMIGQRSLTTWKGTYRHTFPMMIYVQEYIYLFVKEVYVCAYDT